MSDRFEDMIADSLTKPYTRWRKECLTLVRDELQRVEDLLAYMDMTDEQRQAYRKERGMKHDG